jgi:hypothetical protein
MLLLAVVMRVIRSGFLAQAVRTAEIVWPADDLSFDGKQRGRLFTLSPPRGSKRP